MLTINCINLEIRKDRMNNINKIFTNQKYFKIKKFKAIFNKNGALGCLSSHLEIIKLNYDNPYIIVIEDDIILKESLENIYNILQLLIKNKENINIFNGNPSYYNYNNNKNIIYNFIEKTPFVNIKWGQSTSFVVYFKKSYDKLINILEKNKLKYYKPIDILISENFIQTTYNKGHLVYQRNDFSDISKRYNTIKYIEFQKKMKYY